MSDEHSINTMSMLGYHTGWFDSIASLQHPHASDNRNTCFLSLDREMPILSESPHKEFFLRFYPNDIRPVLESASCGIPNYAVFASSPGYEQPTHRVLPLEQYGPSDLIVGRHKRASLRLPTDEGISLRHLLIRASFSGHTPLLRVMDLCTQRGFHVMSQGMSRVTYASGHAHLFGMVGDSQWLAIMNKRLEWPESAQDAWELLERDTFKCSLKLPPLDASGEEDLGSLFFSGQELPFSRRELQAGVLLGRYDRCQVRGKLKAEKAISRVHALLWWDHHERELWLIDTASTNGCSMLIEGKLVSMRSSVRIKDTAQFMLAGQPLRWSPGDAMGTVASFLN